MPNDYETRLEMAVAAASDGCTPQEIAEEADIPLADACRVYDLAIERRKRQEARRGSL